MGLVFSIMLALASWERYSFVNRTLGRFKELTENLDSWRGIESRRSGGGVAGKRPGSLGLFWEVVVSEERFWEIGSADLTSGFD